MVDPKAVTVISLCTGGAGLGGVMEAIAVGRQGRKFGDGTVECRRCGEMRPVALFRPTKAVRCGLVSECDQCRKARGRAYRDAHLGRSRERVRDWCREQAERRRQEHRAARRAIRLEVITAYGGRCDCCGESATEFLAIDHRFGDGATERKKFRGDSMYRQLKRLGFPKDRYRLLCHNCNVARGLYGYCPHERQEASACG